MGKERSYSRVHCKVDDMPEVIRAELEKMLRDTRYTYQDIAEQMGALGYEISKSSIHRYAMRTNAAAQRLREAGEQTRVLIEQLRDNQDVEATEVATAILMDGLINRIASAEEEFDELPLDKAGRLLTQLQRSSVYKNRFKAERRRTIDNLERSIMEQLRDQVQDDDELLKRLSDMVSTIARREAARDE